MLESIKGINPEKIISQKEFQEVWSVLLNVIEEMNGKLAKQALRIQELADDNSRLKRGNSRPMIKASKKASDKSSQGKENGNKGIGKNKDKEKE